MKKNALKGKALLSRLTGISLPIIGGASWIPPANEQDIAARLLVFLEDRRALFNPFPMEIGPHVVDSVLEIRKRIVKDLETVDRSRVLGESLTAMGAACRVFLDKIGDRSSRHLDPLFTTHLGELRALFGIHIARLAFAYDLEVSPQLEEILPPVADQTAKRGDK